MGKTLLEFQSNKGDVLPPHKVRRSRQFLSTNETLVLRSIKLLLVHFLFDINTLTHLWTVILVRFMRFK